MDFSKSSRPDLPAPIRPPLDKHGPDIIYIREGWPRHHQIAEFLKEFGRIVVSEKSRRIEPQPSGARERGGIDEDARRIVRRPPVGFHRLSPPGGDRRQARERNGERQRIFLIWAAAALAANPEGGTAGKKRAGGQDAQPQRQYERKARAGVLMRALAWRARWKAKRVPLMFSRQWMLDEILAKGTCPWPLITA
jgi:hypothetical protein